MEEMIKVIPRPDMDLLPAIRVTKETVLDYKNDKVEQTLKDLVFDSKTQIKGENYTSEYHTIINLKEGDILIFEEEDRGYILPVDKFMTVTEVIEELKELKEV